MIITLSEEDKSWLDNYSKTYGVSIAEAIRTGISLLKRVKYKPTYHKVVYDTSGIWKKGDGLKYQKKLRSEWK